jgi:DNA-binding CsgD family transcriptional regulator/Tfp pilus assembly protein PilF
LVSALYSLGLINYGMGHLEASSSLLEESIEAADRVDDPMARVHAENVLAFIYVDGEEHERARLIFERHVAIARKADDLASLSVALGNLASTLSALGRDDEALQMFNEATPLTERSGSRDSLSQTLSERGAIAIKLGRIAEGAACLERGLQIALEDRNRWAECVALSYHGIAARHQGEFDQAIVHHHNSLTIATEIGVQMGVQTALVELARICFLMHRDHDAAELLGAADGVRTRMELAPFRKETFIDDLKMRLGSVTFKAAYTSGLRLENEQAVERGLNIHVVDHEERIATAMAAVEDSNPSPVAHELTARELDVLRLVGMGKTNAQIGEALFISPFTAKTHVANLLGKLQVANRAAAASWASAHGLSSP